MKKEYRTDGRVYRFYPSVASLVAEECAISNLDWMRSSFSSNRGKSWWGVDTVEEVDRALNYGWPEGTAMMHEALAVTKTPEVPSIRRKKARGPTGDFFDIHRANRGDFQNAWERRERRQALSKTTAHITIAVDVCCSASTQAQHAMWRGAAAVAIAEAAIKSGRSVRIVVVAQVENLFRSPSAPREAAIACEVKAYSQRVSTDLLMTFCALPGMFRKQYFKAFAGIGHKVVSSLGQVQAFDRSQLADSSKMVWIGNRVLSPEAAQKTVDSAVEMMSKRVMAA